MLTFDIPLPDSEALLEILRVKAPGAPDLLHAAFRDWASQRTGLTPRDAVLILHFASRRTRIEGGKHQNSDQAFTQIVSAGKMVLTRNPQE